MWLMKTLLTSGCTNQRGAGHRALGGWSLTSKVPLRYAKRFIEVVSNQSNYKRTKHSDMHLASPETNISQRKTSNLLEDNVYDEDFTFKDLFN